MKKGTFRSIAFLMAVCMLFSGTVLPAQAYNPGSVDFLNTYVNTGNQRQDIIGVALTQMGYREKTTNDTKYGDWYGLPNDEWCAMFISWCARQAEISTDIIQKSALANPRYFEIKEYSGSTYTPKPGDIFFTANHTHTGLVWYVEGDFFYSIEGNANYMEYDEVYDPTQDSYYVVSNKRLIKNHTFGVPEYEGCDKEHDYVRSYETAHPHKVYYKCRDCEDKYYTGYTECVKSCKSCFSCGCSASSAGYYEILPNTEFLRLRTGHSWNSDVLCYVTVGSVVYVHGIDKSAGWAYIDFYGMRGHIPLRYLQAYPDPPASPTVVCSQTEYIKDDTVTVRWNTVADTEQYRLQVFRDGEQYVEETVCLSESYTLQALPAGTYQVQVTACNRAGASDAGILEFTVRDTYTVTYDPCGGSGAPESLTQVVGQTVTISDTVPAREGYTFLGWTQDSGSSIAELGVGDSLYAFYDVTLYAVWRENDAVPQELTVYRKPDMSYYLLGETLDTTGLQLQLTYSDGSGHVITEGFEVSGFEAETYGEKTLTISFAGLTTTCQVQVVPYIPGDIDLNRVVNRDDVVALLLHVSMPDTFQIEVPADFTGDGLVTRDDVIALLLHVSMPDAFPLQTTTLT